MKIILYVNSYIPDIGGREIVVHYLAREYRRMGHNVRVVGPSGWVKHRRLKFEYPVHRWPTLRGMFKDQVNYAQLFMDMSLWGGDVIHAHNTFPNGYTAAQLKKRFRVPLVITPHGEDIHKIPELGFGVRMLPAIRRKIEVAIKNADILTSISDGIEASMKDAGCPSAKIRRIPNGIDCVRFQSKNLPDIRSRMGIEREALIILSVGNYHPRKGHEVTLEAMPHILKKIPNAHLIVVGRGTERLQPLVAKLDIANHVSLTGAIAFPSSILNHSPGTSKQSDDRLAAIYCNSSVYVSAGIGEGAEGLSLAVLDAMAACLPVVATRISGNKDIVNEGRNGFLVPPSDPRLLAGAVVKVLENCSLQERMGEEALKVVKPFDWHDIALRYLKSYDEAIEACR